MERDWRKNRHPVERTPQALAATLNSHAENWEEIRSRIPQESRKDGFCILLSSPQMPTETLIYCWNEILLMQIDVRSKDEQGMHVADIPIGPVLQIEGVEHPEGFKGIVLKIPGNREITILENGFIEADLLTEPENL